MSELNDRLLKAISSNMPDLVKSLLAEGANPNCCEPSHDIPALALAVVNTDDFAIAKILLYAGAELERGGGNGHTPLIYAARYGDVKAMNFLLEQGADIDGESLFGNHPLRQAANRGQTESVRFLLERGANPRKNVEKGTEALGVAANAEIKSLLEEAMKRSGTA